MITPKPRRAHYTWGIDGDCIVIIDRHGPVSVTKDAEQVIADIAREVPDIDSRRVIYRDTDGQWIGLLTSNGHAGAFLDLDSTSLDEAKAKWRRI